MAPLHELALLEERSHLLVNVECHVLGLPSWQVAIFLTTCMHNGVHSAATSVLRTTQHLANHVLVRRVQLLPVAHLATAMVFFMSTVPPAPVVPVPHHLATFFQATRSLLSASLSELGMVLDCRAT